MTSAVPLVSFVSGDPRVRQLNEKGERAQGEYVLYWMQAYRRADDNAALAYAIAAANRLRIPCVVYEALRPDYPYASDRFHAFVIEGAKENARRCEARGLAYAFFLPRRADEARGVVKKLSARAALVVSDDSPGFVYPRHNAAAAAAAPCAYVVIDDDAVVPLSLFPKPEHAARTLRPKLAKALPTWLLPLDEPEPAVRAKGLEWPFAPAKLAGADARVLAGGCEIDHAVRPIEGRIGGTSAGEEALDRFLRRRLSAYAEDRNDPSREGQSGLSPYLHFGMVSARRVALAARDHRAGAGTDAFLEELLVRRGLAYQLARTVPAHATYDAIPTWAKDTLAKHAKEREGFALTKEMLEDARSPDPLWNAAQLELRARGKIHGYARMLWGKLVLSWFADPREAHALLVEQNDKYALDGRDPNGYANIAWCFGLHDRPWPERPAFGTVRSMTSASARRKLDFEGYIDGARSFREEL